jgi:hypothetical protein
MVEGGVIDSGVLAECALGTTSPAFAAIVDRRLVSVIPWFVIETPYVLIYLPCRPCPTIVEMSHSETTTGSMWMRTR